MCPRNFARSAVPPRAQPTLTDRSRPPDLAGLIAVVVANAGESDPLAQLARAVRVANDLERSADALLGYFVECCREAGLTWSQISNALGVTRQAVHKRFALAPGSTPAEETSEPAIAFERACRQAISKVGELGFHAGGWMGITEELGATGAARYLLDRPSPLPVFSFLVGSGHLELSLEAMALRPEFSSQFDDGPRKMARTRLEAAGYDRS